jgi:putative membrane protein
VSDPIPPRPDREHGQALPAPAFVAWRRLHPAAIAVWTSGVVGGLALPIAFFLLVGRSADSIGLATIAGGIALTAAAVRWSRFWYRLDERALHLRGGLLQRWERTIQLPRIQSVDVVQKLTHRTFGVVELRIEVVGGQSTEAPLVALRPDEAARLRALLMSDLAEEGEPSEPPLVRMRPGGLLVAGLTGGRVAVVAAIAGWAIQLLPEGTLVENLDRLAGTDRSDLVTVLLVAGALLVASVLISLATTVVVYWGFTAHRRDDRLVITRGLLQTRRSVIPLRRIQAIRIEENLIRRAFGLASMRVLTAGYGKDSGDQQQASMLVPVAIRQQSLEIAEAVLGSEGLWDAGLHPAPRPALVRRLAFASTVGVAALFLGLALPEGAQIATFPVLPAAIGVGYLSWRALGHGVGAHHVVTRSGALQRRTTVAARANVQHLILHRSPTQRPFGLASLTLAIPRATATVIDVDDDVAQERFEELADRLSRRR